MSTITCVYWLQSGRLFAERAEPDTGVDSVGTEYKVQRPPGAGDMVTMHHVPSFAPAIHLLTFKITETPAIIAEQYALGRRRFHYRETSGWKSDEELMEEKPWPRAARRPYELMVQHVALMRAGAFPLHTCALPPGFALHISIAATYGLPVWKGFNLPELDGVLVQVPKYLLPPDIS